MRSKSFILDKYAIPVSGYIDHLFPRTSLRRRFLTGSALSIIGTGTRQGLTLLTFVLMARFFDKGEFARISIIHSTMTVFTVFSGLGIGMTVTRYLAEYRKNDIVRAGNLIGMSIVVCLVMTLLSMLFFYGCSSFISEYLLHDPQLNIPLRLATLFLLFNTLTNLQSSIAIGLEAFKLFVIIEFLQGIFVAPLVLVGCYISGISGAIIGFIVNSLISFFICQFFLKKRIKSEGICFFYYGIFEELKKMWSFSMPTFLSGISVQVGIWIVRSFLTGLANGYDELSIFEASWKLGSVLLLFGGKISIVLIPILAPYAGQKNQHMQNINILISWAIGAVASFIVVCFPEIFSIIYGELYSDNHSVSVVSILMVSVVFMLCHQGIMRSVMIDSKMWWWAVNNLLITIILVTTARYLLYKGAVGIALAFLISYGISMFFSVIFLYYYKIISKNLFFSLRSIVIWVLIISALILSLNGASFFYRSFFFSIGINILIYQIMLISQCD